MGRKKVFPVFLAVALGLGACGTVHATSLEAFGKSGRFCKDNNAFAYEIQKDGRMNFGLSFWFPSGANCGIIGNAQRTDSGWFYEVPGCTVAIQIQDGYVTFAVHPENSCRAECGAQAYLSGTKLPLSSFEGPLESPGDLTPRKFYNTPCKEPP